MNKLSEQEIENLVKHLSKNLGYDASQLRNQVVSFFYKPIIITNHDTGEVRNTTYYDAAEYIIKRDIETYFEEDFFNGIPLKLTIECEDNNVKTALIALYDNIYHHNFRKAIEEKKDLLIVKKNV